MAEQFSRRAFLRNGAAATAAAAMGPTIIPSYVWAGPVAPSDKITLGFIGVGGMGQGHLHSFVANPRARVLAVADPYGPHREQARSHVGPGCDAYVDYRQLLARRDIDAVVIATPDHWHALTAVHACEAGKDVFCEKPLSLTIEDGRAMRDAARRYGRVFQVGSQQRTGANFRFACELVRNGRIGKVHTVTAGLGAGPTCGWDPDSDPPADLDWDLWLGPAPWVPFNKRRCIYNFRWFFDYSGGKMTDWGAHHIDIGQWGLGMDESGPVHIEGSGQAPSSGLYNTFVTFKVTYTYANGTKLIASHEGGGTRFEGDAGWVHVDRGFLDANPKDLLHEVLGPGDIRLYDTGHTKDDWTNCRENFLDCVWSRQKPICDVDIGYHSIIVCHLGNIAMRMGRAIHWDPVTEDIIGDEAARRWLSKPYRAPWHL